jgi:hypothetical protein
MYGYEWDSFVLKEDVNMGLLNMIMKLEVL